MKEDIIWLTVNIPNFKEYFCVACGESPQTAQFCENFVKTSTLSTTIWAFLWVLQKFYMKFYMKILLYLYAVKLSTCVWNTQGGRWYKIWTVLEAEWSVSVIQFNTKDIKLALLSVWTHYNMGWLMRALFPLSLLNVISLIGNQVFPDILSAHELHEFKPDFFKHVNVASKKIHPVSVYT